MKVSAIVNRAGYNAMATTYSTHRKHLGSSHYLHELIKRLPKQSSVLDIGCGNGTPIEEALIRAGHLVTGLDISPVQIEAVRKHFPTGFFRVMDMESLQPEQFKVDGVVCYYALFHIPRVEHGRLLSIMASFLPVGGWLLLTMGDRDFEGLHALCGEQVWSSHYGPTKNRVMVRAAGFTIVVDEMDASGGEKHQVILAKKSGR